MTDYTSHIKAISAPIASVYTRLSDLSGLSKIGDALQHHPEASKISIEAIDQDSCAFVISGAGRLILRVVEREPNKTIKLEAESSPIPLTLWIQLVEASAYDTRLRLTLRTELNFLMKKMLGGKLQDGVDRMADLMAAIPYAQMP